MIQRINPPTLYDASPFGISQASVDESGLIFLSGQVAWDVNAQVVGSTYAEQTEKTLDNLELALQASNSDMNHVLQLRVYIRGEVAEHLDEVMPILSKRIGAARPSLTGIGVASLATPETLLEIEAVARVRKGD